MKIKSYKTIETGTGEIPPDYPDKCFDQILAFLGYGFCKCVWEEETVFILDKDGYRTNIPLKDLKVGDKVMIPDKINPHAEVLNIWKRSKQVWTAKFDNGLKITTSLEHRYLCEDGEKRTLTETFSGGFKVVTVQGPSKICSVEKMGERNVVDIEVDHPLHCFYASGVAVSNSHALSYSVYSAIDLWLKAYYPLEFMCVNLSVTPPNAEKKGISLLDNRVKYCRSLGIKVFAPDVRYSSDKWIIHEGGLMAPLTNLKGFGINDYTVIVNCRPFKSITDFMDRTRLGSSKFDILCLGGALDYFGEREYLFNWFHEFYEKQGKKKKGNARQLSFLDSFEEEFEIKTQLSKPLQSQLFREYNGFSMEENLLVKYSKVMKDNPNVRELGEVLKSRKNKHNVVLCRIMKTSPFTSRSGTEFMKISISDGNADGETVMKMSDYRQYERTLKEGNVLLLPIQLDDKDGFYIDNLDRIEARIIERAS